MTVIPLSAEMAAKDAVRAEMDRIAVDIAERAFVSAGEQAGRLAHVALSAAFPSMRSVAPDAIHHVDEKGVWRRYVPEEKA